MSPSTSIVVIGVPKDEGVLAAVGHIAIRHGQLDHILRMTIRSLTGVTISEALDATSRDGSAELRSRIKYLAKKRLGDGPALIKLQALLERARQATEARNEILHGLWAVDGNEGTAVHRTHGEEFSAAPTARELNEVATKLADIAADLNKFRFDGTLANAVRNSANLFKPSPEERA